MAFRYWKRCPRRFLNGVDKEMSCALQTTKDTALWFLPITTFRPIPYGRCWLRQKEYVIKVKDVDERFMIKSKFKELKFMYVIASDDKTDSI